VIAATVASTFLPSHETHAMTWTDAEPRLLIVPGLHGSGTDHWQTRLEQSHPRAVRVALHDWSHADLDTWANAIGQTLSRENAPPPVSRALPADPLARRRPQDEHLRSAAPIWIAVAHSFGCLALAHYLLRGSVGLDAVLLVAPANPERFNIPEGLLDRALPVSSTLVFSRNDPWMTEADARYLGRRWGSELVDAGEAGHINPASGHGPWSLAQRLVQQQSQLLVQRRRPAHVLSRLSEPRPAGHLNFAMSV
jgi:uncharacterized protein